MKAWIVHESYKPSTELFAEYPTEISNVKGCKNSFAACQLLLYDGKKNHFILGREFSIPDEIEIPMYRIEITSELPVTKQFIGYYTGQQEINYGDKLIEQTSKTYSANEIAAIYLEFALSEHIEVGSYSVEISVYRSQLAKADSLVLKKKMTVEVLEYTFPDNYQQCFNLDIWQQPSNLARTYDVSLWSDEHFRLIKEMAASLAKIGQKAVTVIAAEIPWKGWFNYIVKDYPANLYEYSMIKVNKNKSGKITCDFSILDRYINCFFQAGIRQEINVFGLLGIWQPPYFPAVEVDYPEPLVIRYYDEATGLISFINQKADLHEYIRQLFAHFKELGIWEKVRIVSDEPKKHQISMFKDSLLELKTIDETIQVKATFDKDEALIQLLSLIDYPVTSYYCTCNHYKELSMSHSGKTQYYVCNYPDKPNTFLHSSLLETRLQGILAYHFNTNGLLRWAYNCWPKNAREDIRYNTGALPVGDLCLIYPTNSGHLALSLRYKQLQRGIEDFYLIKQAEKHYPKELSELLDAFLVNPNSQEWMIDSHHSDSSIFHQTSSDYEKLRDEFLALIKK